MDVVVPLWLVVVVITLVSIARHPTANGAEKGIWILVTLLIPVLGPILWFVVGKRACGRQAQ